MLPHLQTASRSNSEGLGADIDTLVADFADPWEHARLLSDGPRNAVLEALLTEQATGRVVVEVGCGTGVFSVLAAQLGAAHVYALEPTELWTTARDLVLANGLSERVTVLPLSVEAFAAEPPVDFAGADLVVSELLNADPFAEGVVEASAAARGLLRPGGILAPGRLDVSVALVDAEAWQDLAGAQAAVQHLGTAHGLDLGPVVSLLAAASPEPFVAPSVRLRSTPRCAFSVDLYTAAGLPSPTSVVLTPEGEAPVGGIAVWFSAAYGGERVLSNRPGRPSHWGTMVVALPRPTTGPVRVLLDPEDGNLEIHAGEAR